MRQHASLAHQKSHNPNLPTPHAIDLTAIPDKAEWITTERIRWSTYFNVPMSSAAPPGFPINTLPIQRALCSLSLSHPESLPQAIALFWENTWVHWTDPVKPENLRALVRTIVGSDEEAGRVLERCKGEEVKGLLSGNTQRAFGDGAFGLPYFVGEFVVWGEGSDGGGCGLMCCV
jgi:2-hydroxychromene-2-carboxylate isomerase